MQLSCCFAVHLGCSCVLKRKRQEVVTPAACLRSSFSRFWRTSITLSRHVNLRSPDGKEFRVHQLILSVTSPFSEQPSAHLNPKPPTLGSERSITLVLLTFSSFPSVLLPSTAAKDTRDRCGQLYTPSPGYALVSRWGSEEEAGFHPGEP